MRVAEPEPMDRVGAHLDREAELLESQPEASQSVINVAKVVMSVSTRTDSYGRL